MGNGKRYETKQSSKSTNRDNNKGDSIRLVQGLGHLPNIWESFEKSIRLEK